jgi:hypothetical protein
MPAINKVAMQECARLIEEYNKTEKENEIKFAAAKEVVDHEIMKKIAVKLDLGTMLRANVGKGALETAAKELEQKRRDFFETTRARLLDKEKDNIIKRLKKNMVGEATPNDVATELEDFLTAQRHYKYDEGLAGALHSAIVDTDNENLFRRYKQSLNTKDWIDPKTALMPPQSMFDVDLSDLQALGLVNDIKSTRGSQFNSVGDMVKHPIDAIKDLYAMNKDNELGSYASKILAGGVLGGGAALGVGALAGDQILDAFTPANYLMDDNDNSLADYAAGAGIGAGAGVGVYQLANLLAKGNVNLDPIKNLQYGLGGAAAGALGNAWLSNSKEPLDMWGPDKHATLNALDILNG